jgi:hypothetical protein
MTTLREQKIERIEQALAMSDDTRFASNIKGGKIKQTLHQLGPIKITFGFSFIPDILDVQYRSFKWAMIQNHKCVIRTLAALNFFNCRRAYSRQYIDKLLIRAAKRGNAEAIWVVLKHSVKKWRDPLQGRATRIEEDTIDVITSELHLRLQSDPSNVKCHRWNIIRRVFLLLCIINRPDIHPMDFADVMFIKDSNDVMDALLFNAVSVCPQKHQIAQMLVQCGRHSNESLNTAIRMLGVHTRAGVPSSAERNARRDTLAVLVQGLRRPLQP